MSITGFVTVTELLNDLAAWGFFSYVLPFLIVFALVFGILSKSDILGKNKGVLVIISIALGLLALVNDTVPRFFGEIIPLLGGGIIVILIAIILIGLFADMEKWGKTFFAILGGIIFLIIVYMALFEGRFSVSAWWEQNLGMFLIGLAVIGGIAWVAFSTKGNP